MEFDSLPEGFTDFDMFVFSCILFVEGVSGFCLHAISLLAFLSIKDLRTSNNLFVFNLSVADIGFSVNALFSAYATFLRHWPYGSVGCQFHAFQGMASVLASICFLGAIAWDKYHQYCTGQKLTWSTATTITAVVWLLSVLWAAFPLTGWGDYDFEPLRTCCTLDYTRGDRRYISYMLCLSLFFLIIPAYTMQSSYKCIYNQFKRTQKYKFNTNLPLMSLMFSWGPYALLCVYAAVDNDSLMTVSPKLRMVFAVLAKSSTAMNFLLYAFGSESYRAGIWNFLTGMKVAVPEANKKK